MRGRRPSSSHHWILRDREIERASLSILLHRLYRFATPAIPEHELLPSESRLARFMKCRQRLGPRRGSSAADQRARRRATATRRWSFELPPPRAGEVAPARDCSGAPQDLPGGDRAGWERAAPLRRGRVRALPALRHSRQRLRSRALHRLRRRAARRVLLQEPWHLSVLHDDRLTAGDLRKESLIANTFHGCPGLSARRCSSWRFW